MDNYLIDQETLSQFVDELIKKKPLQINSVEELDKFREENIKNLDAKLSEAIFSRLTDEQNVELNQIFENDDGSPEKYEEFFNKIGLNIEDIMTNTLQAYQTEFLGGQNA